MERSRRLSEAETTSRRFCLKCSCPGLRCRPGFLISGRARSGGRVFAFVMAPPELEQEDAEERGGGNPQHPQGFGGGEKEEGGRGGIEKKWSVIKKERN